MFSSKCLDHISSMGNNVNIFAPVNWITLSPCIRVVAAREVKVIIGSAPSVSRSSEQRRGRKYVVKTSFVVNLNGILRPLIRINARMLSSRKSSVADSVHGKRSLVFFLDLLLKKTRQGILKAQYFFRLNHNDRPPPWKHVTYSEWAEAMWSLVAKSAVRVYRRN